MYVESSGSFFSLNSTVFKRESTEIGLSAIFCAVQAVFLVILTLKATEEAPLSVHSTAGGRRSYSPLKRAFSSNSIISGRGPREIDSSTIFDII